MIISESIVKKLWNIFRTNTDVIESVGLTLLNIAIVASKTFSQIPDCVEKGAMAVFNFIGIIRLNYGIMEVQKSYSDIVLACQVKDWHGVGIALLKTAIKVTSCALTVGLFTASLISLFGAATVVTVMFKIMIPLGIASFAIGMAFDSYDFFVNKKLHRQLAKSNNANVALTQQILSIHRKGRVDTTQREGQLAVKVVRQMDFYTFKSLQRHTKVKALQPALARALAHESSMNAFDITLNVLGYVCRGIYRAFPGTLLQVSTTCAISALWTGKLIYHKAKVNNIR